MDILYTLLSVTVSLLAVFGLWCAIKFPVEAFFSSGQVVAALQMKKMRKGLTCCCMKHIPHFFVRGCDASLC